MNAKDIGEQLVALRANRPQYEVAARVGISVHAMDAYERGERIPRDEVKVRLCAYYGRTLKQLFFASEVHEL